MPTDVELKERMDDFEEKQKEQLAILKRLEFAICGDLGIGHAGIIRTQENHSEEIKSIKKEIYKIQQVNIDQTKAIGVKKGLTDDFILWGKRIVLVLIGVILVKSLLNNELTIVDIVKGIFR